MDRTDLHKLVNPNPDSEIPTAGAFLDFLILRSNVDPMEAAVASASEDDEEYSEALLLSLAESREEAKHGAVLSHDEMKQRYGLA